VTAATVCTNFGCRYVHVQSRSLCAVSIIFRAKAIKHFRSSIPSFLSFFRVGSITHVPSVNHCLPLTFSLFAPFFTSYCLDCCISVAMCSSDYGACPAGTQKKADAVSVCGGTCTEDACCEPVNVAARGVCSATNCPARANNTVPSYAVIAGKVCAAATCTTAECCYIWPHCGLYQVGSIAHVASVNHYLALPCLCYLTLTLYSFLPSFLLSLP
jgi:hypothetical protein